MNRNHPEPVARPALAVVPAVTGAGSGNAGPEPVTGRVTGSVTPLPETPAVTGNADVVPLTVADRAGTAARRAVDGARGVARELWTDPGRLLHSVVHGEADTMKEHWAHVQSRSWVPEEMTGRPEKAVAIAGILHHLLVAYPVKGIAKAGKFACEKADHSADRAITLYGLIAFVTLLIVLLIHL